MRRTTNEPTTDGTAPTRWRHGRVLATLAALALVLAACGGGDDADAGASTSADPAVDASDGGVDDGATEAATGAPATSTAAPDDGGTGEDEESGAGDSTALVNTAETDLGTILVTVDGQTLYGFTQDTQGESSSCSGGCLETWPALLVEGDAVPAGLDAAVFDVVTRDDGGVQLTAGGWPLYTYAPDAPGDTSGQGVGDVWWVVAPDGTLVTDAASTDGEDGD